MRHVTVSTISVFGTLGGPSFGGDGDQLGVLSRGIPQGGALDGLFNVLRYWHSSVTTSPRGVSFGWLETV